MYVTITPFTSGGISTASVGNTSAVCLAAGAKRRYAILCNTGAAAVYLALGVAAESGKGIYLAAGQAYEMNAMNLFLGDVYAISGTSSTLSIQEGY